MRQQELTIYQRRALRVPCPPEPFWPKRKSKLFRSKAEVQFAQILTNSGVEFEFEPHVFFLPSGRGYVPDFYTPHDDTYYEVVSGRMAWLCGKTRYTTFMETYPNVKYKIVLGDGTEYVHVERQRPPKPVSVAATWPEILELVKKWTSR